MAGSDDAGRGSAARTADLIEEAAQTIKGLRAAYAEVSADADRASMVAAFWRARAIDLGADPDEFQRFERSIADVG